MRVPEGVNGNPNCPVGGRCVPDAGKRPVNDEWKDTNVGRLKDAFMFPKVAVFGSIHALEARGERG